jgi:hypothetical protein
MKKKEMETIILLNKLIQWTGKMSLAIIDFDSNRFHENNLYTNMYVYFFTNF